MFEGIMPQTQTASFGEAPCQNCGKMVTIMLPFLGCVFCSDCIMGGDSGWNDGTEDFYDKRREKEHFFGDNIRDAIKVLRRK